jgi:hypothetical protein
LGAFRRREGTFLEADLKCPHSQCQSECEFLVKVGAGKRSGEGDGV